MAVSDLVPIVLSGIFGSGAGAALQAVFTSRASAKKIGSESAKLEAETESLRAATEIERQSAGITGSETAVKVMVQALESLRLENNRLSTENERLVHARLKDADRIAVLEKQVQEYSDQLVAALTLGSALQEQLVELRLSMSEE